MTKRVVQDQRSIHTLEEEGSRGFIRRKGVAESAREEMMESNQHGSVAWSNIDLAWLAWTGLDCRDWTLFFQRGFEQAKTRATWRGETCGRPNSSLIQEAAVHSRFKCSSAAACLTSHSLVAVTCIAFRWFSVGLHCKVVLSRCTGHSPLQLATSVGRRLGSLTHRPAG